MANRVVAIIGSYRKGGIVDQAVQAILDGARSKGAETQVLYLTDLHVEFCTNCRNCTQEPGERRGTCLQNDDLEKILGRIDAADAVVLASPVNCWNVTAIFRRFMERLLGYAYWPWGNPAPMVRNRIPSRRAALVASSAAPGFLIPLATGAGRALAVTAKMLGAVPVGKLWIGFAAKRLDQAPSRRVLTHARRIGMRLV